MRNRIGTYLAAGLLVVLPAFITGYALLLVFRLTEGLVGSLLRQFIARPIPGAGFLATLFLLFLAGAITTNIFGRRALAWAESLLARIPVVGGIYSTTRQFTEAISSRGAFRRVVMVEYPRTGLYSLGFLTGQAPRALTDAVGRELANVFVPTVPNVTTGFLLHVPVAELTFPPMTVDEGLKLIVSAGLVAPGTPGKEGGGPDARG